jgi:hypothetical protein
VRLDVDALGRYLARIPAGQYVLVIVDPMYRILPPDMDENSNADFAEIFAKLQGYAGRLDAALMVVHHLSKGDQSGKATTDLGSGGGSQARAADAHLAIRPHAEEGAAVLSGVVRAFPPFPPFCIRWKCPLWELAPDLDPTDMYRPPTRKPKPKQKPTPILPTIPPEETLPGFVAAFLGPEPRPRDAIVADAVAKGVKERRAEKLLKQAEGVKQAHRWTMGKDKRAHYANRPQPKLTDAGEPGE